LLKLVRTDVAKLSQRQAALAAGGMSESWWRQIETGQADTVPADTVAKMAYAIDVSPEQLRSIGEGHVADLVERRRSLLAPEPPASDEGENHLLHTPGATATERAALVAFFRSMRQARSA
jgi:transcriptional regulator with XRE-family HTH domain